MQYINIDPDEEEVETPHCSDWAHIAVHFKKGKLISKSNPYFGEIYYLLVAIHLAHSTEQMKLLADTVTELMEWCELHGLPQPGKYTTKQLREAHLTYPWLTFSIGTYDGMNTGCHDLPLILTSNQ